MNNLDNEKKLVAEHVLDYIPEKTTIGVGSGSTVNYFIESLAKVKDKIEYAVASSNETKKRLMQIGIEVIDLNVAGELELYIDGADEINQHLQMIKGGGGALTMEKIVASASKKFICIADHSKKVINLGEFPVAVEVLPIARSFFGRKMIKLGANPVYRQGFITDSNNVIIDVFDLNLNEPEKMEFELNNIAGVVANGIFATRYADILLLANNNIVDVFSRNR